MFCRRCGTNNAEGSAFCISCGAPLNAQQQNQQYQPQQQNPYPQQNYNYAQVTDPRLNNPGSNTGAKVLYIIVGVIACLAFLMPFLPSVSGYGYNFNVFTVGTAISSLGSMFKSREAAIGGTFITVMFIIPMALQIPWAILSFLRKGPAGVFGLISSIFYFLAAIIWTIALSNNYVKSYVTLVPYLMIIISIAGFVLSIIQLAKKKYLR